MAVDKNKVTAEAMKLVQKGAFDKAIKLYEKILAEDPKDVRVLLKVAELHQKKGDSAAAAAAFGRAAETYSNQGFFLKAVAVYKQMMKLAPDDVWVNEQLAGLYQQLGILSDAMAQLQLVAQGAEKAGDGVKLLDVLRRMIDLDPDNAASSVKLGELYVKTGQPKLALDQFRRAAEGHKRNNRTDEYVKVAERIALLDGNDVELLRELAHAYLAKGDTKRALAKLQLCFKLDPKDVETLTLLAQAFNDLGQVSKTVSVCKELAHLHAERGSADEARATWRRVAELAPDDATAAHALGTARAAASLPAAAARVLMSPPAPAASASAAPPPVAPRSAVAPPAPASARPPSDAIPKLLTETDVYVKYGLLEKALEHLAKVFAIDPDQLDAREKARDLRAASNDAVGAAEEGVRAVRIALARGLDDRARAATARLREIAPSHAELAALAGSDAPVPVPVAAVEAAGDELADVDGEELVLELELEPAAGDGDDLALEAARAAVDDAVEEDGTPASRAAAPVAAAAPAALVPPLVARPPAVAPPVDLEDDLQEADFLVDQGLVEEAREVLSALLLSHPCHEKLAAKLAELEGRSATDLARELAEELGATAPPASGEAVPYSLEDVFSQFKKGVEQTVKPEDADTHYDLGIAYKEMGLIDDAVHEFEVALSGKGRKKEVDCLTMIGLCRMERGDGAGAVVAFRRALRSDFLAPEAARAVHYELGAAHASTGDKDSALHYLHKVLKVDPRFRDTKAFVARLGGGSGRPPPGAGPAVPARAAASAPDRGPKKNIGYV
jgi:tetratricopeptide (TPR) repeat protein